MDQTLANKLLEEGGVFILLDFPDNYEFGIDFNVWYTGPRFMGIKMIPPGCHFIFFSSVSKEKQRSPRSGFFHWFERRDTIVRRWDRSAECISSVLPTAGEEENIRLGLRNIESCLGAYPFENHQHWHSLNNHITRDLLKSLSPINMYLSALTSVKESSFSSSAERALESLCVHNPDELIRFTPIPTQRYPAGSSPAEVTQYSLDQSYILDCLLRSKPDEGNELWLLGELQYAFLAFLLGEVFDAFDHWKALVTVLSQSDEALRKLPVLMGRFVDTLQLQLADIPEDFLVDIVSSKNFLFVTLQVLFESADDGSVSRELQDKVSHLRQFTSQRFGWDFSVQSSEDLPMLVEL